MGKLLEKREETFKYAMEVKSYNKAFDDAFMAEMGATFADGALPGYVKKLMALTAALAHGSEGCIMTQTLLALESGATADQIMEACMVAICMGGSMALAESAKVRGLLHEKGLI